MRKKLVGYSLYLLIALFLVVTGAADDFLDGLLETYPLEYATSSELFFCTVTLSTYSDREEWENDEPLFLSKYERQEQSGLFNAEKVLAYKKDIEQNQLADIDIYFNYDENLIQIFQKEFTSYLEEENITIYRDFQLYYFQVKYLMENDNENALYVCQIWNDIVNKDSGDKRHRQVIDLLVYRI
jgi:hypothetical protein